MTTPYTEPLTVIRNILLSELNLTPGQVMASNQKFEIPTTGLYIYISYVGPSKVISRMSELVPDGLGGENELQSLTMHNVMDISIMAYNDPVGGNQARSRMIEIPMAMGSIYAEQQQEQFSMKIARHPGAILDTSFQEETEMMTRYSMTYGVSSVIQKQKSQTYFNSFTGQFYRDDLHPLVPTSVPPVNPFVA